MGNPVSEGKAPKAEPGDRTARRQILEAARLQASRKAVRGPGAARNQDVLYGDDGLPE